MTTYYTFALLAAEDADTVAKLIGEELLDLRAEVDQHRFEAEALAERCKAAAELLNERLAEYMLETGQESHERYGVKIALRRETTYEARVGVTPEDILDVMRELEIKDAEKVSFKDSAIPEIIDTLKASGKVGLWNVSPNTSALRKYVRTRLEKSGRLPQKLDAILDAGIYTTVRSSKA